MSSWRPNTTSPSWWGSAPPPICHRHRRSPRSGVSRVPPSPPARIAGLRSSSARVHMLLQYTAQVTYYYYGRLIDEGVGVMGGFNASPVWILKSLHWKVITFMLSDAMSAGRICTKQRRRQQQQQQKPVYWSQPLFICCGKPEHLTQRGLNWRTARPGTNLNNRDRRICLQWSSLDSLGRRTGQQLQARGKTAYVRRVACIDSIGTVHNPCLETDCCGLAQLSEAMVPSLAELNRLWYDLLVCSLGYETLRFAWGVRWQPYRGGIYNKKHPSYVHTATEIGTTTFCSLGRWFHDEARFTACKILFKLALFNISPWNCAGYIQVRLELVVLAVMLGRRKGRCTYTTLPRTAGGGPTRNQTNCYEMLHVSNSVLRATAPIAQFPRESREHRRSNPRRKCHGTLGEPLYSRSGKDVD